MEEYELANIALGKLGAARITALTQEVEQARVINNIYGKKLLQEQNK